MPFYLAIDAGGTKTQCLLADPTRILARASTGSIKLMRVSEQEATTRLHFMFAEVAASASIALSDITRTCIGLAGLSIPAVRAWATNAITAKVSGELILLGDEEIALNAAFKAGPGILVIAGTGSKVIGRAPDGTLQSAGGMGPILGDEGSGYWIGLEALRAAFRAQDTPSTTLLREIQRHWNLASIADLVAFANHRGDANRPAPDFAALAPIVARSAEQGNTLAARILHRAGEDLAQLVTLVAQKMTESRVPRPRDRSNVAEWEIEQSSTVRCDAGNQGPPEAVAYTGSVLTHIAPVRAAMISRLAITLPSARVQPSAVEPLKGALWRARQVGKSLTWDHLNRSL